ncbi:MAG: VCBS repeat-containing protein [Planctomycetes bacterium]|nr:VCBS repeat-containing protein [Planctomycetota bacterium]
MLNLALVALGLVGCAGPGDPLPHQKEASLVWTQAGFADFSKGRFGDGGVNTFVSASGQVQLVNRFDFNNDGFIDLVFANSHPQAEKLDQSIYWGNGKDFDGSRMTLVPNEGAQWTVAADLNGDGNTDAIVPSYANGTWSKMPSAVYYGGAREVKQRDPNSTEWTNYPFAKKVSLPTEAAQQAAVDDLNKDGYPDIVFALSAGFWEYRGKNALASPSRIFWGSKDGYNCDNFTDLEAAGASDVAIADLNNDGWPDLVFANREKQGKGDTDSFVYFGGSDGFTPQRRAYLPTRQVNAVALADVNGDKWIDILFANGQGDASTIYLSQNGSLDAGKRIDLPTSDARDVAAGDLNGDGCMDVFFTNHQTAGNRLTTSYLYFNDGKGAFSPERRQEFETIGAWGASIGDLNKDGRNDIVISNFQEHESFEVPSYIFWNSKDGFDQTRRTSLFTQGAVGNTIADFNNDGHLDVCFNNTTSRWRGGVAPAFVYWGSNAGEYSTARMLKLPAVEPYDWAAGDLNDDGWPDLIIANMAEIGRRITENFVFWGGPEGFSAERRSALMGKGTRGISVADLDKNGWLDVVCLNTSSGPDDKNLPVFIYWGEPHGFVTNQRTEIPGGGNGLPLAADLNSDGALDLILTGGDRASWIYWGDGTRNYSADRRWEIPGSEGASSSEVADMNRDGWLDLLLMRRGTGPVSYVYYGNEKGEFTADRRIEFKPNETQGVTVADTNGDGWLDVIAPRYKDGGSRATLSRLYFGSSMGLSEGNTLELPTNAGTGSQVSDYNRDGYADLLLYCHRSEGDPNKPGRYGNHTTDSYLYWGGPKGFDVDRKLLIPGEGVHYDGGIDLGNIKDRGFQFDFISPPHHHGNRNAKRIEWKAQTPHGSSVLMQVRTAPDEQSLERAKWVGPQGIGSVYESSGSRLETPTGHGWIQYRAILVSPNGAVSPALEKVSIHFD